MIRPFAPLFGKLVAPLLTLALASPAMAGKACVSAMSASWTMPR